MSDTSKMGRIEDYHVLELIGEGSFGKVSVFLALSMQQDAVVDQSCDWLAVMALSEASLSSCSAVTLQYGPPTRLLLSVSRQHTSNRKGST